MKKKVIYEEDDGRTIAPMESKEVGVDIRNKMVKRTFKEIGFSKKETRAMIRGAYSALLPAFLIFLLGMSAVCLLIYLLW